MRDDNIFEKLRNKIFGEKVRYKFEGVFCKNFLEYEHFELNEKMKKIFAELDEYIKPINERLNEKNLKIAVTHEWGSDKTNGVDCKERPAFQDYCQSYIAIIICDKNADPHNINRSFYVTPVMCTFCKILRNFKVPQFDVWLINLDVKSSHDAFYRSIDNMVAEAFEKLSHNN